MKRETLDFNSAQRHRQRHSSPPRYVKEGETTQKYPRLPSQTLGIAQASSPLEPLALIGDPVHQTIGIRVVGYMNTHPTIPQPSLSESTREQLLITALGERFLFFPIDDLEIPMFNSVKEQFLQGSPKMQPSDRRQGRGRRLDKPRDHRWNMRWVGVDSQSIFRSTNSRNISEISGHEIPSALQRQYQFLRPGLCT